MKAAPALTWLLIGGALFGATGCAARTMTAPTQPFDAVTLLPDPDTGHVGHIVVSNEHGAVDITSAWARTRIDSTASPTPPGRPASRAARRRVEDAVASMPEPPRHFTVLFRFDTDEVTNESIALLPSIVQASQDRAAAEILLVGHTDTPGTPELNLELGQRRAEAVKTLLLRAHASAAMIETSSRGETELLVATDDDMPEPRNRRVDVTVR